MDENSKAINVKSDGPITISWANGFIALLQDSSDTLAITIPSHDAASWMANCRRFVDLLDRDRKRAQITIFATLAEYTAKRIEQREAEWMTPSIEVTPIEQAKREGRLAELHDAHAAFLDAISNLRGQMSGDPR